MANEKHLALLRQGVAASMGETLEGYYKRSLIQNLVDQTPWLVDRCA